MICPKCGQENREGRKFCSQCAGLLQLQCPSCRVLNEPGEKFCGECGSPLAGETTDRGVPSQEAMTPAPTSSFPGRAALRARAEPVEATSFANGRYQVKRFLGEGGKKRVYLAHDTLLDRDVTFALIKAEGLDDVARSRIRREAQAISSELGMRPLMERVLSRREILTA